jgi:hypothetical protein
VGYFDFQALKILSKPAYALADHRPNQSGDGEQRGDAYQEIQFHPHDEGISPTHVYLAFC